MKKKLVKLMSFVMLGAIAFFGGIGGVSARTAINSTFIYDYTFHLRLAEDLEETDDGWYVAVIGYADVDETTGEGSNQITFTNDDIYYEVTEIDEDTYNELLEQQDGIDGLNYVPQSSSSDVVTTGYIGTFQSLAYEYWCYQTDTYGDIYLPKDCEEKYYIVTVDAYTNTVQEGSEDYNHHTARVYKVEATTSLCSTPTTDDPTDPDEPTTETPETTTTEENPSTNVATPYVIGGAVLAGAIGIIIISKKKKFI